MKRKYNKYLSGLFLMICCMFPVLQGCVDEIKEQLPQSFREGETWVEINFGAENKHVVTTRANAESENQLFNFYLFIFDNTNGGKQVYGKMFDEDMMQTAATFPNIDEECWYVEYPEGHEYPAKGKVKVKAPLGPSYNIYMIGNLDADMIRISSELLNHTINSEQDLKNFEIVMNQEVVSRNGYFPMSGSLRNVKIEEGDGKGQFILPEGQSSEIHLLRFDAKIEFVFKAGDKVVKGQKIKSFEAKQWRVINVPRTSYALSYSERLDDDTEGKTGEDSGNVPPDTPVMSYSEHAAKFFDTNFTNFEDIKSNGEYGFTFYMLPNRMTPKNSDISSLDERSRQVKRGNGRNQMVDVSYVTPDGVSESRQMRVFENANDFSTYVLVTGRVEMELTDGSAGQILGADVQYLIHLGDWNNYPEGHKNYNPHYLANYNVRRNKNYKYTVTVNSVDKIVLEVDSSKDGEVFKEEQPGATGDVVIAKEEIAICDAHYSTKTLTFHLSNFYKEEENGNNNNIAESLTWKAKTPFGEGEPVNQGGVDVPTFPDYKWVHFRLNRKETGADGKKYYSENMRKYITREFASSDVYRTAEQNLEGDGTKGEAGYHNDGVMDIIYLVKYIKEQVRKYETDKIYDIKTSDFDDSADPQIKVTAFVDEYYYEEDPWTHEKSTYLWKEFVNAEDRSINILSASNSSKDGESKVTGSVITIQQHAIRCIYNTDPSVTDLKTAWGLEMTDEYGTSLEWGNDFSSKGNTDNANGLLNSLRLWGLCGENDYEFYGTKKWEDYVVWEVENDVPILNDAHKKMAYSCLSRNRDNNGNGIIDRNEIRWYMASIRQLVGIYAGDAVVPRNSRLYNRSAADMESKEQKKWAQHVVSSTQHERDGYIKGPIVVWAEEGISTGHAEESLDASQYGPATLRCVRNLGNLDPTKDPEKYDLTTVPQSFGVYRKAENGNNAYFDATYLNSEALRYYTSRELEFHSNNSIENRLYRRFEICPEFRNVSGETGNMGFDGLNTNINNSILSGDGNPFCPVGYRLPNQRELAMLAYFSDIDISNQMSRTYWIFGRYGGNMSKETERVGFSFTNTGNLTLSNRVTTDVNTVRCVRDVRD